MRRRELITLLGGAAVTWPLAARAQQPDRKHRVGVLMASAEDDPESKPRLAALRQGLEKLGWSEDRNIHLDVRFALPANEQQVQTLVTYCRFPTRDPKRSDCIPRCWRPDRRGLHHQLGTAGRQSYRPDHL